jgi:glycogen synthase
VHIGYLTFESPWETTRGGGIAAYLRAIVPAIAERGHRVTILTGAPDSGVSVSHGGLVRTVRLRLPNLHWYLHKIPGPSGVLALSMRHLEWSARLYQAARALGSRTPLDVIESPELGALFLATSPFCPLVVRLHGSDYVFRRYTREPIGLGGRMDHRIERMIWNRAKLLTAPSRFQAEETACDWGAHGDQIRVVPNPIAPAIVAAALRAVDTSDLPDRKTEVFYCGRLARVKGIEPLLEAARMVSRRNPNVQFVLAGPWQMPHGVDLSTVGASGSALGNVRWVGHVPWPELPPYYQRASLFVMPSYYESFGIACLEAMSFGLPVVATLAGGLPEVIQNDRTGILVPPGQPTALADAILDLLEDGEKRRRFGLAGRERVLDEFTAEKIADATLNVYAEARA